MKNVTAITIILALALTLASCTGNNAEPAETGATTAVTTTGGSSPSPTETTASGTVTTATETEPIDVEAFLSECTVYDVTLDMSSYHAPFEKLEAMNVGDKPAKIALRFSDAEGLTIMMELVETSEGWYNYYVRRIFTDTVNISVNHESNFIYLERTFWIANSDGIILINNGSEASAEYYFISGGEYDIVKNNSLETGYILEFYENNGSFEYAKISRKYYYAVQTLEDLMGAYESDDAFYMEKGSFDFEAHGSEFIPEYTMTFGEWYSSDFFPYKDYFEKYGNDSFASVIEAYQKHETEGNLDEFWIS